MAPGANDDDKGPSAVIDGRHEDAFDDEDDDLDDEFAELQRIQSAKRREAKDKAYLNRIQEILPFAFAPNIRPLGISDLQSAIVLENAAFSDPRHRASPEKVGVPSPPPPARPSNDARWQEGNPSPVRRGSRVDGLCLTCHTV